MAIGARILAAMQQQGLSQSELARRVGVSQSYISNLISGRKGSPSQSVVRGLASELNLPAADLFALAGLTLPQPTAPFLLGVSGASGSGKSWFASKLQQLQPGGVTVISQDRYYKSRAEVAQLPFGWDEPASLFFDDLLADLNQLKAGKAVAVPTYDFVRHERAGTELVHPAPMVVVEGHLIFCSALLLQALDETVWVHADDYQLLRRRLLRDSTERGRDWREVLEVFEHVVMPASALYVKPNRAKAAVELNNNRHNPHRVPLLAKSIAAYAHSL